MENKKWLASILLLFQCCQFVVLQDCSHSRDAYVSLGYPASQVPSSPQQGQFNQLCPQTIDTCCSTRMEATFENATLRRLSPLIPSFSAFLATAYDVLTAAEGEFESHMRHVRTFLQPAVLHNNMTSSLALQQVITALTSVVEDNLNASRFAAEVNRLLVTLRLNLLSSGTVSYSQSALDCAVTLLSEPNGFLNSAAVLKRLHTIFSGRYRMRELLAQVYLSLNDLASVGLPVNECVRSYSQLFFCHICGSSTAGALPCDGVCDNVAAACAGHMHILEPVLSRTLSAVVEFSRYEATSDSWDARQALGQLGALMLRAQSGSSTDLAGTRSEISSCSGLPAMVAPLLDVPLTTVSGALHPSVPTRFSIKFTQPLVDYKVTVFNRFSDISQRFTALCSSGTASEYCWARTELVVRTISRKVDFGEDALYSNPDVIINGFDTDIRAIRTEFTNHVAGLSSLATSTMTYLSSLTASFTQPSAGWRVMPLQLFVLLFTCVVVIVSVGGMFA